VPEKQTVNGKFYKEVIKRLIARVHLVRPEFQESGSWCLLHDNTPVHSLGVGSEVWGGGEERKKERDPPVIPATLLP
jgi:hypothetical protein